MSMHIVLEAIERHWKDEEKRGNDLSANHKDELIQLSGSCEEALKDLDALLNKHQALGKRASFRARMKWAPKDIGPIRNRLILRTTFLSTFNCTIA